MPLSRISTITRCFDLNEEIERIRQTYQKRDASGITAFFSYQNPAFAFHMLEREWAILTAFRELQFDLSNAKVLEVGCGSGHILQRFIEFGAEEASGIELMENRVAMARQRYPRLHVQQGDAASLPYSAGTFDVVMQFMCISSVLDKKVRKQIANEMWRVLRPGGVFMSYDLRPPSKTYRVIRSTLGRINRFFVTSKSRDSDHATPIDPLGLEEFRSWGLGVEMKVYSLSLDFKLAKVARHCRPLAELLASLPWLRTSFLIVLRKPLA